MTLKVMLVLLPHVSHNLISPHLGSNSLSWHHWASQFTHIHGMCCDLEIKWFLDICVNILRVVYPDEVVKRCKCRWNEGLKTHVILQRKLEDSKTSLENPKNPLNNIAS